MVPKTSQLSVAYIAGIMAALAGILVLIGWQLNSNTLKTLGLMGVTMKANTALSFIFTGLALVFLQQKNQKIKLYWSRIFSFATIMLGALVLSQDLFNINLGIDELLFNEATITIKTFDSVRMAPNTSLNFILLGITLLFISFNKTKNNLLVLFFITLAICISVFGIIGYVFGISQMTGLLYYTKMAFSASIIFTFLFVGILFTMYHDSKNSITIERKLFSSITVSFVVILFVSLNSISSIRSIVDASDLVINTEVVKGEINKITSNTSELASNARGFILSNNEIFLENHQQNKINIIESTKKLKALTINNPARQEALISLDQLLKERIEFSELLVETHKTTGKIASEALFSTLKGKRINDKIEALISQMIAEENSQLKIKNENISLNISNTFIIISLSLFIQIVLLALIFIFVLKDLSGKRKAEKLLQNLNEELECKISERTAELSISEEKYRNLIENSLVGVYSSNLKGELLYANEAFAKQMEYDSVSDLMSVNVSALYKNHSDRKKLMEELQSAGQVNQVEYEFISKHSNKKSVIISAKLKNDKITGMLLDVTERKNAENLLKLSEEKFKNSFHHSPIGIALISPEGKWLKVNKAVCDIVGYSEEELLSKTFKDITHPDDLKEDLDYVNQVLKGEISTYTMEKRYFHKNGSIIWVSLSVSLVNDDKGAPLYFISQIKNISESRAAAKEMQKLNRIYAVLSNINQTIVRVNDAQTIFDETCRIAVEDGKFKMAWIGMVDKSSNKVKAVSSAGFEDGYLKTVNIDLNDEKYSNGPTGQSIKLGVHIVSNDIANDPKMIPWRENAIKQDYKSSAAFPIKVFGETIGCFMLYSPELFFFDETEVKLLDELAMDISFGVEFLENEKQRKEAEEKLNRNEALLLRTGKMAKVGGWDLDLQTMELTWSPETYHIYEIDPSVKPDVENAINFYAPKDRPIITKAVQRATEEGLPYDIDAQFTTAKGNNLWVRSIGEAVIKNGKCVRLFGTFQDITERKQDEEEILNLNRELENKIELRTAQLAETNKNLLDEIEERKQLEDKFKLVVESSPNAIILVSSNGIIQLINQQTENYFGYNRDELIGNKIEILVPDAVEIGHLDFRTNFTSLPTARNMGAGRDLFGLKKDGTKIPVEVGLNPILINNEMMILTSIIDITERKKADEEIKNAKSEAERANLAKSEFLSRMSHELRTPLNSILGFTQLMIMGELDPTHKKGVDHIMKSGKHLLNLINEVLDLSRIEAGELSLSIEPVEIKGLLLETLDLVYPLAIENNIKLELTETDALQLFVKADNQKLKQVLLNLINNAIKYNIKDGLVTIAAENAKNEKVRISITDTGKGIAQEELSKLFTPFQRIGKEISAVEGTGLGLAVSKKLTEAMDGTIGIESEVGKGSTFWIELPRSISQIESHLMDVVFDEMPSNLTNKSGTILYIEDNISNQELVKQILEMQRQDIKLITGFYGKDTLKLAFDYKPSLILLDLDLPDMHGSKVLELLKKNVKTKSIPVIILSADAMDKQINTLLKLGAKAYLTKPLDVLEFLKVIDGVINID
ncbi:MAG: PAS domain S-box protein [Lutibacter sp.]|nr:PAS domain S-box protein [Lutibacter sp.]